MCEKKTIETATMSADGVSFTDWNNDTQKQE